MSILNEETDLIYNGSAKNALSFFVVLWYNDCTVKRGAEK